MNKQSRILLVFSGVFGTASVAMGALGAHAFHDLLMSGQSLDSYEKAVDYAMYGALALLAIAILHQRLPNVRFFLSGYLALLGTLLFSGSLFISTLTGVKEITFLTPWGGMSLIFSWLLLALLAAFSKQRVD